MSSATSGSSISAFLAMQGPMKTTLAPGRYARLITRPMATIGETIGVRLGTREGKYFLM